MVKYQNGKIYKITSNHTDQVYIGSTCSLLCKRMAGHRGHYRMYLDGQYPKVLSFDILVHDDAVITLVEDHPCDNKEQLLRRERFHIENTPNCINKYIPGRTDAEYRECHKEDMKEYLKVYRNANKDVIARKKKAWYEANKIACAEKKKLHYQVNKNAIAQKAQQQNECACGGNYTNNHKMRHLNTTKHKMYVANAKKDDNVDWLDELTQGL